MKIINKIIVLLTVILAVSCSNEPSLQKYFVENSESPDFIAIDLGSSVINTDKIELTEKQEQALESFEKLNILAYKKKNENDSKCDTEKQKVAEILKNKSYEELARFGSNANGAAVYLVGDEEDIDEFVLFGSNEESGFLVARVLGDDMTPNDVLNLVEVIQRVGLNLEELKPLEGMFKK